MAAAPLPLAIVTAFPAVTVWARQQGRATTSVTETTPTTTSVTETTPTTAKVS